MGLLADGLALQKRALEVERARIETQAAENLAAVDEKLAAIAMAEKVITKEVEASYELLLKMGMVSQVVGQ